MKISAVHFVSILVVLLVALFVRPYSYAADSFAGPQEVVLDSVLASIDGEPVTLTELRRHVATQMYSAQKDFPKPSELTLDSPQLRKLLQDLVLSRLLDKEADAVGISVSNEEIDAYIAEIRRQNNVDEDGFIAILKQQGLTRDEYVLQIKNDILKNRVVSARVRNKINIVDEDVQRYLSERPELAPAPGSIRLQQIRIPASSVEEMEAAKKQIAGITAQLGGLEGRELRQAFVRAGGQAFQDLGHVSVSDLREEIQTAVAELQPGQVSAPVEIGNAAYLFFLAGRVTEETPVDEALEDEIRDQIFQAKFQEELRTFLDVDLPKRYHVEFKI